MVFNRPPPPPVPLRQMERHFYDGFNTICQYLRDIWQMLKEPEANMEEIQMKLRVAMSMAKSMDKRLREEMFDYWEVQVSRDIENEAKAQEGSDNAVSEIQPG